MRTGKPNQDSYRIIELPNAVIIAVADGHGSDSCPYSKNGSAMAVRVFCKTLSDLCSIYNNDLDALRSFLDHEGAKSISSEIEKEWKRRVARSYIKISKRAAKSFPANGLKEKRESIWKQYGTTLMGLVLTPTFIFAYQLGDGNITISDNEKSKHVIIGDNLFGIETYSLSNIDAWRLSKATTLALTDMKGDCSIMLSTDGFANSYSTDILFLETILDYHRFVKEHGVDAVESNLASWLNETSRDGSGDDITVVIVYFQSKQDSAFDKESQCIV